MTTTLWSTIVEFVRSDRSARLVTDGHVSCPYSGSDVDVDLCLECPALDRTFDGKSGETWVRCSKD
jgi:hypothetical protein